MMKFLCSLSLVVSLVGCATTYQSESLLGGFSSSQLDENVFQVSFKGNAFVSPEKASDYSLLRAAEIALEKGYKYFVIADGFVAQIKFELDFSLMPYLSKDTLSRWRTQMSETV